METDQTLFQTPWVSVKQTPHGFYYLERKGRDSVGIFLLRRRADSPSDSPSDYEVLIRWQPLCIDSGTIETPLTLHPCPITGGLDGEESPITAAVREVHEEAGYTVSLLPLGQYIVGTQTNEICHLYYADVTGLTPIDAPQDGSFFESISQNRWYPLAYLKECDYAGCQIGYYRLREVLG
jgi:8-oxo-dGTP diphosphatase